MSHGGIDRELGDKLLQIYDEVKSHPLRKSRGYAGWESVSDVLLGSPNGMDTVSFSIDAKRYTFRCFDFFISGLGGGPDALAEKVRQLLRVQPSPASHSA